MNYVHNIFFIHVYSSTTKHNALVKTEIIKQVLGTPIVNILQVKLKVMYMCMLLNSPHWTLISVLCLAAIQKEV